MPFTYEVSKFLDFKDTKELARCRAIKREDICKHKNKDFKISIIDDVGEFYGAFAVDIVSRIVKAKEENRNCVLILPVGPVPQYAIAARMINTLGIDCKHLITFNMDEYADQDGNTAPPDWEGSFETAMWANFFGRIDPKLRPPKKNIHFPNTKNINRYSQMIQDAGEADCCYGGIGWCGHIAFWESSLGYEFDSFEEWQKAGARIVELTPLTIVQNCLHSFGSDWSWVPPKAATIGPRDIVNAKDRSFWLDGAIPHDLGWQRFIARLAAHVKPNRFVPGSVLQLYKGTYTLWGPVADNVEIHMA
jgi:glucosamine-6-phosphate deaminase